MTLPGWLLVVDAEINPAVEEDWNRWYDEVHLPEIASCPGFGDAARYVSEVDGQRHYVTVYELSGPEAIASPEFAAGRGWAHFAEDVRATVRTYRRITPPTDP
jgi:hypothetical protein